MHVTVFSTKEYDQTFLDRANKGEHHLAYLESRLTHQTVSSAAGSQAVCAFVNDELDVRVLSPLQALGIGLVVLRCAGFNNVDLEAAARLGIAVARVPEYSPHSVAEHAVALILSLNRKLHRAYARVREGNFALDGLMGFELHGRTVGIIGTGKIGTVVARIMTGFGCRVLAADPYPNDACRRMGVGYVSLATLLSGSDIVTLHCPLNPDTFHLIDAQALASARPGAMFINTSRGAVIETRAMITALKSGQVGALGLDVYEEEAELFFQNLSDKVIQDDVFARLLTFPNVLITGHQGFFTTDALMNIAETTIANISAFANTGKALYQVSTERLA